jgi:Fe-Mn family superoxide dismutase
MGFLSRRTFLQGSLAVGGALSSVPILPQSKMGFGLMGSLLAGERKMPFQQPPLPYPMDALVPYLSEEQIRFHYGKHHAAYFKNLNALVEGKPEEQMTLREVVIRSTGPVFNNAAQAWNHTFYWNCMAPKGGGEPAGELAQAIRRDFGSFEEFKKAFSDAAVKLFGSGWAWLATDKEGKLAIMALSNADTPLKHDKEPVLTIDVWEHAYYIDYRNERARFVEGFWNYVHWPFAAKRYSLRGQPDQLD